jgi:hypothetical protein
MVCLRNICINTLHKGDDDDDDDDNNNNNNNNNKRQVARLKSHQAVYIPLPNATVPEATNVPTKKSMFLKAV